MKKLFYTTLSSSFQYEIPKIKGSRFFGTAFPISSKEDASQKIGEMKKKYFDATHNCSAFTCGIHLHSDLFGNLLIDPKEKKVSDDGEPTNTAGKPMLSVLEGEKIFDCLLVVTRYFGGTLLGVGGLIQAYTLTAQETLKHMPKLQKEILTQLSLSFGYDDIGLIHYLLSKYEGKVLSEKYETGISQTIEINSGLIDLFKYEVEEKTMKRCIIR